MKSSWHKFSSGTSSHYKSKVPYPGLKDLEARDPSGHNNDGDGNDYNDKGVHDGTFVRLTNSYVDGKGQVQGQHTMDDASGGKSTGPYDPLLPAARAVSNAVMDQKSYDGDGNNSVESSIPNSFGVNEFFQFFGQVLTHDIAEAATGDSGDPPILVPIPGPPGGVTSGLPFPINRTPYDLDEYYVRQQINEETSFLDLSMVYGNKPEMLELVRANTYDKWGNKVESAKLLMGADDMLPTIQQVADENGLSVVDVLRTFTAEGFGGLPDPDDVQNAIDNNITTVPGPGGFGTVPNPDYPNPADPTNFVNDYVAGDNRVNQTPLLVSQQTIWAREHNYQVDKLAPYAKKYGWSQDDLFEAARAVTEAEWQKVVYKEYLPKLIGEYALGEYEGYDSTVDPSIINDFTTVAFRFGHDQSSLTQQPLNEDGSNAAPGGLTVFTLATAFIAGANGARSAEDLDAWIRGQLSATTQEIDGLVSDGNRNLLFGIGVGGPTADLEVFDIVRARDHGVASYNQLREAMGLNSYDSFEAYAWDNGIDIYSDRFIALKDVYGGDIWKLDAIIGGLLEEKYMDSQLGETFTKLIAYQFENLRDGDQLYYENRFADDPKLLGEIEATSLADILARTTGIDHIYRDAFAAHDRISDTDGSIYGSGAKDLAVGTDYGEAIHTYGGDDDVYAGKGNDYIFDGYGNDWMWGGDGKDIYVFDEYSGKDVIKDFSVKYDKIDLTELGIDSWKEAKKLITKSSDGVVIQLDYENSVELVGVKHLSKNNFIYDSDHDYGIA